MEVTIEMLKDIFMWCSIVNIILFAWALLMFKFFMNYLVKFHMTFFGIAESEVRVTIYGQMGRYRDLIVVFNIVPYIVLEFAF